VAYTWDFGPLVSSLPLLWEGAVVTIVLCASTMVIALVAGAVLALLMELAPAPIRLLATVYTELFRALPLLVLLFMIFSILPIYPGWTLSPFASGLIGLSLTVSAFIAEALRAGITSIGTGQTEAARALGMTGLETIRRVIWPQAWRRTIPIVGAIWVGLFKDSSLVSLIQVHDLMYAGRVVANQSFRYLEVYTIVALIYFIVGYPQGLLVDRLFNQLKVEE
jgi:polar amino acid transport system permease protein